MPDAAGVLPFDEEVIRASHATPILVDFWAPWCGPCRALGPTLDRVAEGDDRFRLVKVNTDEHPELSRRYGIRGIPAVKLFVKGAPMAEFTGVLPEAAVRQFLDQHLPSPAKERLAAARAYVDAAAFDEARPLLEAALADEPGNSEAAVLLAQALVWTDPARAARLTAEAGFVAPALAQVAEAVRTLAAAHEDGALPEPVRAALAAAGSDPEGPEAVRAALFDALRAAPDEASREALSKLTVALFVALGPMHDVTRAHRRRFDLGLF